MIINVTLINNKIFLCQFNIYIYIYIYIYILNFENENLIFFIEYADFSFQNMDVHTLFN